ncbi:MAG: sensor histidine kinase [Sciscionella sp.]|nr:sensor histidine kinase [Sciscionella sp.]
MVWLIQPVYDAFHDAHPVGYRVAVTAVVAVYSVSYLVALSLGPRPSRVWRIGVVSWLYVCGGLIAVVTGDPANLTFLTYAIVTGVMMLPLRVSRVLGLAVAALEVILMWWINGSVDWGTIGVLVMVTMGMAAFFGLINTVAQLRVARQDIANLAVADERARLARDLHDVLGHSLTTITLKTGLARRVLESGGDHDRAINEVREVEQLARQALTEVRATVSGYRKASLAAEIVGARAALRAARIDAELPHAVDNVPAGLQEVFAYVLREGVTNIIRHSGATKCSVRLGENWLEVRDNGTASESTPALSRAAGGGHGLSGLADRLAAVGGELVAEPLPEGGFLLRASIADGAEVGSIGVASAAGVASGERGSGDRTSRAARQSKPSVGLG